MDLQLISQKVEEGRAKDVSALVQQAIEKNIAVQNILDALLKGMNAVGIKFKANEIFVPEVLITARALNYGLEIIKPILTQTGIKPVGKAVIGTVKGDLHDIGKNLVKMMLVGAGLEVIDLGTDVEPQTFIDRALEENAKIICMSALLTTTMFNMQQVISLLVEQHIRNNFIVMVGGAPVTASFAEQIGADYYTADAATAAEVARKCFE